MAYCTLDQLIAQYGEALLAESTDRGDVSTGEIDETAVQAAIDSADALIDGYLKLRYALPLATLPALVNELALPIALYKLHAAVASQKVRQDYDDALKLLAQINAGTVRLDVAGAEPAASGASGVRVTDRERPFTADSLKGY